MTATLLINPEGDREMITSTGPIDNPEAVLERHGYDPTSVEYTVVRETTRRVDDLQDRVTELESKHE